MIARWIFIIFFLIHHKRERSGGLNRVVGGEVTLAPCCALTVIGAAGDIRGCMCNHCTGLIIIEALSSEVTVTPLWRTVSL